MARAKYMVWGGVGGEERGSGLILPPYVNSSLHPVADNSNPE